MKGRSSPTAVVVLSAAFALAACHGNKGANEPKPGQEMGDSPGALIVPKVDETLCDTKGKRVETFDLNRDGKPDVWKLFATVQEGGTTVEALTCKQVDFDHDGVKDYVVTYKDTGEMITESIDLGFDDRFDARHHFDPETHKVFLIERDTDFDKKPDVWEKYNKDGVIESVRRDSNADGKPDIWEQYVDGVLVAILYDDDFDNRVDRKEQVIVKKKKTDAKAAAAKDGEVAADPDSEPPATEGDGDAKGDAGKDKKAGGD